MSFNEPSFLFLFLPAMLALYFLTPRWLPGVRNALLLLGSVVFYIWGGKQFIFVLAGAVVFNYIMALAIQARRAHSAGKVLMTLAVAANLGLLIGFKYLGFLITNLNPLLPKLSLSELPVPQTGLVPLGLSFFTFHAIGYVVDVYRGDAVAEKNPARAALYLLLFPKVVAGPIARYRDMADQLGTRIVTCEGFAEGVRRFAIGLAKKVVISSAVALPADKIFAIPVAELTPSLAWLGLLCYTVQIYFDFSGYSDMAIGLGRMFGFTLPENFNYPYIADSIRDFWRRWHISLSSWLRDYLFIPLGGSRVSTGRVYFNLVFVFLLCGLWHGAGWSYIAWGLYYGLFLVLERLGLDKLLEAAPKPVRHLYTLAVVLGGWVFFRADTLPQAFGYFGALLGVADGMGVQDGAGAYIDPVLILAIAAGVIGSMPVLPWLIARRERVVQAAATKGSSGGVHQLSWAALSLIIITALLLLVGMLIAANTYMPFIYRQF